MSKALIKDKDYIKVKDPVYKYEVKLEQYCQTDIRGVEIDLPYCSLDKSGRLTAKVRYRWDGASGPTIDTASSMRGSLFHDIIWQLIEEGYLADKVRHYSNRLFRDTCIEDGMWSFRAHIWYYSVDSIGRPYIRLKRKIYGRA